MQQLYPRKTPLKLVLGGLMVLAVFVVVALVPLASAAKTGEPDKQTTQSQQICPPAQAGVGNPCQVTIDCPPLKTPGKTTCQITIDCPPAVPVKTDKKKKSK
jgi:hypothetical protein